MAISVCISRFRTSIRLYGTFLKAKYIGTLLVAAFKDGNNKIYPLCFGIGD